MPKPLIFALIALVVGATAAMAQDPMRAPPPASGQKLSALVAKVEARPNFAYVDEIEWQGGAYTITYFTTDRAKVEIKLDPATGEPK